MTTLNSLAVAAATEQPAELDYGRAVRTGQARVAVWGLGHIGGSTVEALRAGGARVVGYDVRPERVTELSATLGGPAVVLSADRRAALEADVLVHFVAVPTEHRGLPYSAALVDVVSALAGAVGGRERRPGGAVPLVVIESTLTPGTVDQLLLPILADAGLVPDVDLLLALAPRRDWVFTEGYTLRNLDRVFAGVGECSARAAEQVLSLMCDRLHRASGHAIGELVKCVENAFRHVEITLANQLTLGYPDVDMVEVLRLAGTKWNMQTFHPSFGTGGYCVPLASRYLLGGARYRDHLSLLTSAVETDDRIRQWVADAVARRGQVLVLGVAYKGDIKVATLSPALGIAARLRELGVPHSVHDPMYTAAEIDALTAPGTAATDLASAVRTAATVLIVSDHRAFRHDPYPGLLAERRDGDLLILDNYGVLADLSWPRHVDYHRAGGPGWLPAHPGEGR